jgi:hypothetical protein
MDRFTMGGRGLAIAELLPLGNLDAYIGNKMVRKAFANTRIRTEIATPKAIFLTRAF